MFLRLSRKEKGVLQEFPSTVEYVVAAYNDDMMGPAMKAAPGSSTGKGQVGVGGLNSGGSCWVTGRFRGL